MYNGKRDKIQLILIPDFVLRLMANGLLKIGKSKANTNRKCIQADRGTSEQPTSQLTTLAPVHQGKTPTS